jgi:L-lactate dehydrogenase complex protein LldF
LKVLDSTDSLPCAQQLADKVIDFSSLVKKLVDEGRLKFKEGQQLGKITYHDSCHLKRTSARQPGAAAIAHAGRVRSRRCIEADMCCGMGGSYSLKLPEISAPILERKLVNIEKTGAPIAVMDCPGCVMQIRGGLDKQNSTDQG